MENFFSHVSNLPDWLNALTLLVSGATAITLMTPTTADDKWLNKILWLLNILAGNFNKNTNKDA